jgi:hypothetical protein
MMLLSPGSPSESSGSSLGRSIGTVPRVERSHSAAVACPQLEPHEPHDCVESEGEGQDPVSGRHRVHEGQERPLHEEHRVKDGDVSPQYLHMSAP